MDDAARKKLPARIQKRWWNLEGQECAGQICAIVQTLDQADGYRQAIYTSSLSRYEGRAVTLSESTYYDGTIYPKALYNLTRAACDSVKADIAGRQKPKPVFVTTGGSWDAARRAKKLDKFVEGQMAQRQGRYANTWELMLDVFHDSAKMGFGCAKVTPDAEHHRVQLERVFPWELYVDHREARYGSPQNLFHAYSMEMDIAIELFVELDDKGEPTTDEDRAKMNGIETARRPNADSGRVVESIQIREAWRLPFSEDDDGAGRHVICVDNAILFEEEWTQPEFPFVMLWWEKDTVGFWGQGIADAHEMQHIETNLAATRLNNRIAICSTKRTYIEPNMVKAGHMEEGGASEIIITVQDITRIPVEPQPVPASQEEFQWVDTNIQRFFQMAGVSQQNAQATKSSGVTAAVAIEAEADLGTQRFMPKARAYEESFITLGRLFVRAAKEVAKGSGGYLVKWPGKRLLRTIDWNNVSLEEDEYDIRVKTIPMFSRDPAAMLQVATDLHGAGVIQRETFLEMIQLPDLEGLLNRETAEREYLEELFGRFMDAGSNSELAEAGGYEAPEPFMTNKPAAMWLAVSTYWEAKTLAAQSGSPEEALFSLDLLERWISQLDKLIAAQSAPPPAPEAPGAIVGASPMPGAMGPPPGAPMAAPGIAA